ncbi:ABC transporter permease [Streptomyces sp. WMMC905]|uniref:ABC transporter permease n=1 Tax=Streptomyces sp. WMMC905 TaxID=3404123 RepID=UPI003B937742
MSAPSEPSERPTSGTTPARTRPPRGERPAVAPAAPGGGGPDTTRGSDPPAGATACRTPEPVGRAAAPPRVTWPRLILVPSVVTIALMATWLWFRQAELDPLSRNALADGRVTEALREHVRLTAASALLVLIIAVPLGVLLTRPALRRASPLVLTLANMGQATPAIGLLALLVVWLGVGSGTALIGIVAYTVLPVLSNTVAGLRGNDPELLEAARGIGMSAWGVLFRVELPLAVPLILAGVRTALVLCVGTATLAVFGGGGGLGVLITAGVTSRRMPVLVLGSVLTVTLALLVDWLASLAELSLGPRGLREDR